MRIPPSLQPGSIGRRAGNALTAVPSFLLHTAIAIGYRLDLRCVYREYIDSRPEVSDSITTSPSLQPGSAGRCTGNTLTAVQGFTPLLHVSLPMPWISGGVPEHIDNRSQVSIPLLHRHHYSLDLRAAAEYDPPIRVLSLITVRGGWCQMSWPSPGYASIGGVMHSGSRAAPASPQGSRHCHSR